MNAFGGETVLVVAAPAGWRTMEADASPGVAPSGLEGRAAPLC